VDLHPFQVDAAGSNGLTHLDAIAGGMVTVGGGQVQQVRAVLGQQGILWPGIPGWKRKRK